jgi:UDP-N-acetylglucosamine 2-epimerase
MKILHVVSARPNFMKIAPIMHAMAHEPDRFAQILVHTGLHPWVMKSSLPRISRIDTKTKRN